MRLISMKILVLASTLALVIGSSVAQTHTIIDTCVLGNYELDATDSLAISYLWSSGDTTPTLTVTQHGSMYTVTTTFSTGQVVDTFTVNHKMPPNPGYSYSNNGLTYYFDATSSMFTDSVYWRFGNNDTSFLFQDSTTYPSQDSSCLFEVHLKCLNYCDVSVRAFDILVDDCFVGIEPLASRAISIWPNPASSEVHFAADYRPQEMYLIDLRGQLIRALTSEEKQVNSFLVDDMNAGVYLLRADFEEGTSFHKIVVH